MEIKEELKAVFNQFETGTSFVDFKTFSSGHINDTYLIITANKPFYVLQRINGNVFKQAKAVIENKVKLSSYLQLKNIKTLNFIAAKNKMSYVKDTTGSYWNLCEYIEGTKTFLKVPSMKIAYEAGRITGEFLGITKDLKEELIETLPNFHSMTFRLREFKKALHHASEERLAKSKKWVDFILENEVEMLMLDKAILNNEIPFRITHNDTKISNILFSEYDEAISLIDLDTVMTGCIHFDYGDALRTICSTANEDETDLSKVTFNIEYFKSYTEGFLTTLKKNLSSKELELLPVSGKIMTFIIGVRFLTDYLNNDIYYKTSYETHNLNRAINQFTLVKSIQKKHLEIAKFILNEKNN